MDQTKLLALPTRKGNALIQDQAVLPSDLPLRGDDLALHAHATGARGRPGSCRFFGLIDNP